MNSLLYYYNNMQKMAAYRQAKRMQRGVKLGYGDTTGIYASTTSIKRLLSDPIPIGTSDFSIEYYGNAYGSGTISSPLLYNKASNGLISSHQYLQVYCLSLGENNLNWVIFGITNGGSINDDSLNFSYSASTLDEKFHLVITRSGKAIHVYIDNVLIASKEQTEVKDLGNLQLAIANSSDVGFVRVWNYALSADEIATLYNNGDPMGYVVPKTSRYFPDVSFLGPAGSVLRQSYTWENLSSDPNGFRYNFKQNTIAGQRLKIQVTVSDYEAGAIYLDAAFDGPYRFNSPITSNGTFTYISNKVYSAYTAYGRVRCDDKGQGRKCTVTVDSVEVVGILAEYLPQNLLYGRDDKTIATSWLDSAKQLPLSDEYMEPLFQSIGGHDMAANGAPEILYNE